jgi:glycosyltransferase involved in cell wall biosynthesis
MEQKSKVLFILKRREDYNKEKHSHIGIQTGLYNSASYMDEMLNNSDIESKLVMVTDNNDIDREVTIYKPTHVIIEALWVVPSKFTELCKLHPSVNWIIRLHSEMPFIANEGIAFDWIGYYGSFKNIIIAANAPRALEEVRFYLKTKFGWTDKFTEEKIIYFPNFYPMNCKKYKKLDKNKNTIDIGCFGAIRPLKNHVIQALAAIKFAEKIGKKLKFHINSGRVEMKGEPILHNLQSLFIHLNESGHELIIHEWMPREEFLTLCGQMDIGMQSSFSETFNIVAADLISQGVPLVGSSEIPWINKIFCGRPTETNEIYRALMLTYYLPKLNTYSNQFLLTYYTHNSKKIWIDYFNKYDK